MMCKLISLLSPQTKGRLTAQAELWAYQLLDIYDAFYDLCKYVRD